jgi:hypothetical protein
MWAVPRLCEFYPGVCLTIEKKARVLVYVLPKHTHTHITKQFKATTVQVKTNTVQDIPK